MNILSPKSIKIVQGLPPVLGKDDRVAIDTEFFNMDKNKLHRPTGDFACATFCSDGKTVYLITNSKDLQKAFKNIDKAVWIFHHAKFDLFHLRRYARIPQRERLWDTMLIEQIMFSGYYDSFSLADLVRRYLDTYLEKEVREEFTTNNSGQMTKEQMEYAALDTVSTWKVYQEQRKIISNEDMTIWQDIELPFLWVLLGMSGVSLDKKAWLSLAERNKSEAERIAKKYPINLNSPAQVKKYFCDELGIKVDSTGVEVLEVQAGQGVEFAKDMLVYRTFSKRSSTYGQEFIEKYVEPDGKIYGDIYQMGAVTGRTSCRVPNTQNIPHANEYRDCFVAGKGNCLVVADYGAQEPRIAAYWSQDEKLIEALNGKEKLYIAIAREVLGKEIKKDSEEYKHIKSTVLGIFYGMSPFGLSKRISVSEREAERLINKFLHTFPGVQEYIIKQQKAKDFVTSIYGRKMWINKYNSGWVRDVLNYPIQSSAADATKLACRRFLDTWCGEDFYDQTSLILIVHDEIVIEVPTKQCEKAKKVLEKSMVEVAENMHEGIKGVAEVFSGSTWGCKS